MENPAELLTTIVPWLSPIHPRSQRSAIEGISHKYRLGGFNGAYFFTIQMQQIASGRINSSYESSQMYFNGWDEFNVTTDNF